MEREKERGRDRVHSRILLCIIMRGELHYVRCLKTIVLHYRILLLSDVDRLCL